MVSFHGAFKWCLIRLYNFRDVFICERLSA